MKKEATKSLPIPQAEHVNCLLFASLFSWGRMSLKLQNPIIFIFADNVLYKINLLLSRHYNIITYHKVSGIEMSVRVLPVIMQGFH